ncbi:MAG: NADH-quinone oxidoreductase subunit J [Acidimicrobiaceae bacterium]|nr:NADH-quinone oxidoreductase subunit J [Acidimicrobiaceae bacterium]
MVETVFAVSAVLILAGAVGVVVFRNPVHAALSLVLTLLGVAVLFVLNDAHFLAAVQVVVYAGAIVILFLFVIMLLGVDTAEKLRVEPIAGQRPLAVVVGAALAALLGTVVIIGADVLTGLRRSAGERALDGSASDIERIGRVLFGEFAFAVEVTAALLTVAVVGAVVLTRRTSRPVSAAAAADASLQDSGAGPDAPSTDAGRGQ